MANPKPVRQWRKGQSGNLSGRPKKGQTVVEIFETLLDEKREGGLTNAEAMAKTLIDKAIDGDVNAAKLVLERLYGRPASSLELKGEGIDSFSMGVIRLPMKLPEGAPVQTEFGEKVEFIED